MAKRITIMIDYDIDKKLRLIQAKQISKTNERIKKKIGGGNDI